jgi:hypothetical protein
MDLQHTANAVLKGKITTLSGSLRREEMSVSWLPRGHSGFFVYMSRPYAIIWR